MATPVPVAVKRKPERQPPVSDDPMVQQHGLPGGGQGGTPEGGVPVQQHGLPGGGQGPTPDGGVQIKQHGLPGGGAGPTPDGGVPIKQHGLPGGGQGPTPDGAGGAGGAGTLTNVADNDPGLQQFQQQWQTRLQQQQANENKPNTVDTNRMIAQNNAGIADAAEGARLRAQQDAMRRGVAGSGIQSQANRGITEAAQRNQAMAGARIQLEQQRAQDAMNLEREGRTNALLMAGSGLAGEQARLKLQQQELGLKQYGMQDDRSRWEREQGFRETTAGSDRDRAERELALRQQQYGVDSDFRNREFGLRERDSNRDFGLREREMAERDRERRRQWQLAAAEAGGGGVTGGVKSDPNDPMSMFLNARTGGVRQLPGRG